MRTLCMVLHRPKEFAVCSFVLVFFRFACAICYSAVIWLPFTNTPTGARTVGTTLYWLRQLSSNSWVALCFGVFQRLRMRRGGMSNMVPLTCFKATNLKMRFVVPGDWIRIKFVLKPLVRHACRELYLRSRQQAGEPLRMVYFRPLWVKHRLPACSTTSICTCAGDLRLTSHPASDCASSPSCASRRTVFAVRPVFRLCYDGHEYGCLL